MNEKLIASERSTWIYNIMEEILKTELDDASLKYIGSSEGGCINEGHTYVKRNGEKIFVKVNNKSKARLMFDGELKSLQCLQEMDVVRVPQAIKVLDHPDGGSFLIMEYLNFKKLNNFSEKLGELMARLHILNAELESKAKHSAGFVGRSEYYKYVDKFGFDVATCCGFIAQDNTWEVDWMTFFAKKIQLQMDLIEKDYGDREASELWSQLQLKLPEFFQGLDIKPALLHGDLWEGNVGETVDGPVVFDPACFYGHSEYDLVFPSMYEVVFDTSFFNAYHKILPKSSGFQRRKELYKLFIFLNRWNHFGTKNSHRDSSIGAFKKLVEESNN